MEFGYIIGQGKKGYILLDKDPDRFDVMYGFATAVLNTEEELCRTLGTTQSVDSYVQFEVH